MDRIALFIPVFNEEEALGKLLERIPVRIGETPLVPVIVDDGSTDHTFEIAREFTPHVVRLDENCGVGRSTRVGFEYVNSLGEFNYVLKMDGDGQHSPDYLEEMVSHLDRDADVVVCSRFHADSDQANTPLDRILLNRTFSELIAQVTGWTITDCRSGYMGFQGHYIARIAHRIVVRRYGVPMEILVRIWRENRTARVVEIVHPAIYGGDVSKKLVTKYAIENSVAKSERVKEAYLALLMVLEDLGVARDDLFCCQGAIQEGMLNHEEIESVTHISGK